jgi:SPP1 gp7 family putative phage head morphogenesis protein
MSKSSKEYWAEREAEQLNHNIKDEKHYDRRINQIYSDMLDNVQKEIDSFYGKYAAKEGITLAEAKKRVSKLDIEAYERKAKRYVRDKDFSPQANEEMRLYNLTMKVNRLEMLKANIGLELINGHQELENFMGDILQGRTEDELERQAGILGKTIKNNAEKAHAIVNASFHGASFSDRIWQYQSLMKADLSKLLQSGLIAGKSPRLLAKDLKKHFGASTFNAERLMRTELARVQTDAQKQSFERNGFEWYEFICNENPSKHNTCDICKGLDGKHFKVKDMMPGTNAPPMHPHCRCSTAAYEDSKEYENWLDHLANGGTTEEYNKLKVKPIPKPESKQPLTNTANSGIIQSAKSFDELEEYFNSNYSIKMDKAVKNLDLEAVKQPLVGVDSMLKDFPELANTLEVIKVSKGGVMSCAGETIEFNPVHFADNVKVPEMCEKYGKSGWWPKNSTPASIGNHEAAHGVEWLLCTMNPQYIENWQRITAYNKCTEAQTIVGEACKNVKKTEYGKGKKNAEIKAAISRYANDTPSECMAEAFADVYCNGENANPLSKEIKKSTIELYKKYKGGG